MAFAKKFEVEVTVPEGLKAGETFKIVVEAPEVATRVKGILNGIAIGDMTDEQLKRELVNSKSVLYKAEKRNAAPELIEGAKARVAAAEAEKATRTPVTATGAVATGKVVTAEVVTAEVVTEDNTVDTDVAAEI